MDAVRVLLARARSPTRCSRSAGSTGATCSANRRLQRNGSPCRPARPRVRGDRPRPVRRHDAGRHGRRRDARRSARSMPGSASKRERRFDVMLRGRRSLTLDLKRAGGAEAALRLVEKADALIEGFRPGVMERLGLGPDVAARAQPAPGLRPHDRLGPGRAAGASAPATTSTTSRSPACCTRSAAPARRRCRRSIWSATSAAAACCSRSASPAALIEARASGRGQVVDAAMVDGAVAAGDDVLRLARRGPVERRARGANVLDSGAPWYDTYETSDGKYVAIGAIEPQFYAELLARLGLDRSRCGDAARPRRLARAARAARRTLRDADARRVVCRVRRHATRASRRCCRSPNRAAIRTSPRARAAIEVGGVAQPAPAPRFDRTPGARGRPPPERGSGGAEALRDWGFDAPAIDALRGLGVGFKRPL